MTREPRIFLAAGAVDILKKTVVDELAAFMTANPLVSGIGKEELKTRLPRRSDQRFFVLLLSDLEKEGRLVPDRDIVRLAPSLRQSLPGNRNASERISALLAQNGLEPPTVKELMELLEAPEKDIRNHLAILSREGSIAKVSADIYYDATVLMTLQDQLVSYLRDRGEITPSEFRELTGLSRKFMIPLLEYFDSRKITIRTGDKRVLRCR
jgi:selenocysteine-specific elongation factor